MGNRYVEKDDLIDIRNQLIAVAEWLESIETRLGDANLLPGRRDVSNAKVNLSQAFEKVSRELCKFEPS